MGRTWLSIDLDWLAGPLRYPHVGNCGVCSWYLRCRDTLPSDGEKTGRPSFSHATCGYDLRSRLGRLESLLERISCRRAVMRDCHASITRYLRAGDMVWHIDAHPDDDPCDSPMLCASWVRAVERWGVEVKWVEPEGVTVDEHVDVFLCLSRAYTPAKVDRYVFPILSRLGCQVHIDLSQ